jgi:diguanylate cyclase (GGDEF)-like protein/PAS domain S-box-containing protein
MSNARILVVEDEGLIAQDICRTLTQLGYTPLGPLNSGEAAIGQMVTLNPQLVLMDISLSGQLDGIAASEVIRAAHDIPIIFLTAYSDDTTIARAQRTTPYGYLVKPFEERELYAAVETALYRHAVEAKLQSVERWLSATLTSIGDAVIAADIDGVITFLNPIAEQLTGWSQDVAVGQPISSVFVLRDSAGTPLESPVAQVLREGVIVGLPPMTMLQTRTGGLLPVDDSVAPIRNSLGQITGVVVVFRDVTEQRSAQAQLERAAFHDALTGLPNRARMMDRLSHALTQHKRHADARFALLCLDLDRFKLVNDSYGHPAGDQLLITVARRLEECVRAGDTVARLGGDEFVILLEDIVDDRDPVRVATRIHEVLRTPISVDGRSIFTGTSVGIALGAQHYETPSELMRDADIALYHAKAAGPGSFTMFDASLHQAVRMQLQLETDLRWAVERGEFCLHYQPIMNLADRSIRGVEALLRWQHPERGLLMPADFLTALEELNLSAVVGYWVLGSACAQLRQWIEQAPDHKALVMSINLSDRQMRDPQLVSRVQEVLASYGLPPRQLQLEVTEHVLMDATTAIVVDKLSALGVQLAIDDFGTGHSALSMLHYYPMATLKIDRVFVTALHEERQHRMIRTITVLAQELGLSVVAEGIETANQQAELAALGCAGGQGFWFAQPMSADDLERLLLNSTVSRIAPQS